MSQLTSRQMAKLRRVARIANELALRHAARRAALHTQRSYLLTLSRTLAQVEPTRAAAVRDNNATREQREAAISKCNEEESRLKAEIRSAHAEFEHLQEQLSEITQVSAPTRDVLDSILTYARLDRATAGINFGADDRGPPGELVTLTEGAG